jgi:hypothetical protein
MLVKRVHPDMTIDANPSTSSMKTPEEPMREALESYSKARDIRQTLADAHPNALGFQSSLALSHLNIGIHLSAMQRPAEALATCWNLGTSTGSSPYPTPR